MKKLLAKVLPLAVVALTLCMAIVAFAACSKADVVFEGDVDIMSIECHCTLTLKDGGEAEYTVTTDSEMQTAQQIVAALAKTGTWKTENNAYVVTLGDTTVTSTTESGKEVIKYSMQGRDGSFGVTLEKK